MRAVVVRRFGPYADARVESLADPIPGADDVVVDVEAAETNYPDLLVMEGRYQVKPPLPFVPGKGAAGRVAALGSGVRGLHVGQRVAVQVEHGAYAEKVLAPSAWCYAVPDGVELDAAAASILTYQTAWWALTDRARLQPGESVLVLGAGGGVGTAAIQLARALGAATVIGATRGTDKGGIVRQAGADHVVDVGGPDLRNRLRADIHAVTDGKGVDIVIDPVGGALFEPALRALAWRGRLVVIGFAGGDIPIAKANYLLVRNISVTGLQASDYRDRWPGEAARVQAAIFRFMERGAIQPIIEARLPLHRFADALATLENGSARGKTLLLPR